jgi:hypothetical protein
VLQILIQILSLDKQIVTLKEKHAATNGVSRWYANALILATGAFVSSHMKVHFHLMVSHSFNHP